MANLKPTMTGSVDARDRARVIVEKLGGIWRGSHGECRCPAHDDRSPSLSVRLGDRAILFHCFAGCDIGAILRALRDLHLHDAHPLHLPPSVPQRDRSGLARKLWQTSVPIPGTPAQDYLKARGLVPPYPACLRYNAQTIFGAGDTRRVLPAMVAAATNDLGFVAVQRTALNPSDILAKPLRKSKAALGLLGNAAIRLGEPDDELGLCEGIEDALSVRAWFGTPTWAVAGIERLALITIPDHVRRVIVYGDHGVAAARGLERARGHLTGQGRELVVRLPDDDNHDWNAAWQAKVWV